MSTRLAFPSTHSPRTKATPPSYAATSRIGWAVCSRHSMRRGWPRYDFGRHTMSYNPLANVAAPLQPQGGMQGNPQNPLARLAGPMPGLPPRPPAPTAAQATAAVRRLSAVQESMRVILQNPDLGRTNVFVLRLWIRLVSCYR